MLNMKGKYILSNKDMTRWFQKREYIKVYFLHHCTQFTPINANGISMHTASEEYTSWIHQVKIKRI